MYANLIEGRLDQQLSALHISSAYGRDVHPDNFPALIEKIESYLADITLAECELDGQIASTLDQGEGFVEHYNQFIEKEAKKREKIEKKIRARDLDQLMRRNN